MKKKIIAGAIAGAALLASTLPVFAHGGNPNNEDYYVDPADKNCMGQLARMHAQDEKWGTNGLPASFDESTHKGFGLGPDYGDTVHDTMHAFQAYCMDGE